MEKNETRMQLPKITVDDLFSTQEQRDSANLEKVLEISIRDIVDFPDHPFKVIVNKELEDMVESIKERGVLSPALVRPKDGKYEMIAGHRRKKASELAELDTIPCIVRDLTDDEATIIMVDSNLQREELLPSEKAFAYKMRLEAETRQLGRPKNNVSPMGTDFKNGRSTDIITEDTGDSRNTIYRYIRLTELIPEILEMTDDKKIAFRPAVEISYLTEEEQYTLLDVMDLSQATPSLAQAIHLKKLSQEENLTSEKIEDMLSQEKPNQIPRVPFNRERLQKVLPQNMQTVSNEELEDFVIKCVDDFVRRQKQKNLEAR